MFSWTFPNVATAKASQVLEFILGKDQLGEDPGPSKFRSVLINIHAALTYEAHLYTRSSQTSTSVENLDHSFPPSPHFGPSSQNKSEIGSQSPPATNANGIAWSQEATMLLQSGNNHHGDLQTESPFLSEAKSKVQRLKGHLDESAQSNAENSLFDLSTVLRLSILRIHSMFDSNGRAFVEQMSCFSFPTRAKGSR